MRRVPLLTVMVCRAKPPTPGWCAGLAPDVVRAGRAAEPQYTVRPPRRPPEGPTDRVPGAPGCPGRARLVPWDVSPTGTAAPHSHRTPGSPAGPVPRERALRRSTWTCRAGSTPAGTSHQQQCLRPRGAAPQPRRAERRGRTARGTHCVGQYNVAIGIENEGTYARKLPGDSEVLSPCRCRAGPNTLLSTGPPTRRRWPTLTRSTSRKACWGATADTHGADGSRHGSVRSPSTARPSAATAPAGGRRSPPAPWFRAARCDARPAARGRAGRAVRQAARGPVPLGGRGDQDGLARDDEGENASGGTGRARRSGYSLGSGGPG